MAIIGEVRPEMTEMHYKTSYTNFYSSMIRVPFFGTNFNTIMPLFIIIFGLLFALLSIFKMKNKALNALKSYNQSREEGQNDKDKKKSNDKNTTLVEQILQGERAILLEYDQAKKKEERNRLLRFNNVVDQT